MMKKILYVLMIGATLFSACSIQNELEFEVGQEGVSGPEGENVEFNVTTAGSSFKVGDEVNFDISGNPETISFYSGEMLNDYAFKDGRTLPEVLKMYFSLSWASVTATSQQNQMAILISKDFNGNHNLTDIEKATWENVLPASHPLPLPNAIYKDAATALPWGPYALPSNLLVADKDIYLGFRYTVKNQEVNGYAINWVIRYLALTNSKDENIAGNRDFTSTERGVITGRETQVSSNYFNYRPNNTPDSRATETVSWVINTNPIRLTSEEIGGDEAKSVKKSNDPKVTNYTHVYTEPGSYTATFVALEGTEEVVKQVNITITEQLK